MALFYRLILGHLLGDFVFQSEWFFQADKKKLLRVFHGLAVGLITFIATLPYMKDSRGQFNLTLLLVIFGITASHILIDLGKLSATIKRGRDTLSLFVIDQILHLAIIYGAYKIADNTVYSEPYIELQLVCFIILAMWVVPLFVRLFESAIGKEEIAPYEYYKEPRRGLALWERGAIFLALGLLGNWLFLLPAAIIPRIILRLNYSSERFPLFNWFFAGITGIAYLLITRV